MEQIEGNFWPAPGDDATRLVRTAHALRREPIGSLGPEGLRLLISQDIGLDVLVPRAITLLHQDPLAEGDYYPGDLLGAVLEVPSEYWARHQDLAEEVDGIAGTVPEEDLLHPLPERIALFRSGVKHFLHS
ncbi:contact-dependent growth inhibition system immunity protein [Streptomyces sp. NPDC057555]|uniref:contact-dependent growth inhibition system immunity protein n=1 Tax=Streptomyces sp. NPDC057555 TaxID=3346166 RepID=UPI00367D7BA4